MTFRRFFLPVIAVSAVTALISTAPAIAAPDQPTTVVVQVGNRSLYRLAIVPPRGDEAISKQVAEIAARDFMLSSMFEILDPKSFPTPSKDNTAPIDMSAWRNVGADGIIEGTIIGNKLELRLYVVGRGAVPVLKKEYDISNNALRSSVHQWGNEVVKLLTGISGSFGGRLVFSAADGAGKRALYSIDSDGHGLGRLPTASDVAMAPAEGPGGVYYAGGMPDGSYQLFKVGNPASVLKHAGLVLGVAFGGAKMALTISENGRSNIWVGAADGSGLNKVTTGGISFHPAFGPGGQLAWTSDETGGPQVYVEGRRVSSHGSYNMAPAFCNDPEGLKLLYMGRDGAAWDIFSVDIGGGGIKRLTQNQGANKYPACSPDGRTVAFFSSRGGLFTSNTMGQNQQKIAGIVGESLRWGH